VIVLAGGFAWNDQTLCGGVADRLIIFADPRHIGNRRIVVGRKARASSDGAVSLALAYTRHHCWIARQSSEGVKRVPWEREMRVRAVISLRAAIGAIIVMLCLPARPGAAEDAATGGGIARPSVEELAIPRTPAEAVADTNTREAMCLMIESAAKAEDLPLEFFARVIWQESRFQADAVGPATRSG
jgi:hypothetical protein